MFGTQLPIVAKWCTRGIYIQFVLLNKIKCNYVMLVDTKGIKFFKSFEIKLLKARDNRLATFRILSTKTHPSSLFSVYSKNSFLLFC